MTKGRNNRAPILTDWTTDELKGLLETVLAHLQLEEAASVITAMYGPDDLEDLVSLIEEA